MPADPGHAFVVGMLFGGGSATIVTLLVLRAAGLFDKVRHHLDNPEHDWGRRHDR